MSGLIANSKWGDCDRCPARNTACKKRGKEMVCLTCCQTEDTQKQIGKATERDAKRRGLKNDAPKVKKLGLMQDNKLAAANAVKNAEKQRWFEERRREMTGKCKHCNGKSEKNNDKYWKYSIAHILPKSLFPSVATHVDNWIELCFHGKSCHTNFDNHMIDLIDLNCFDSVIEKFVRMYPEIAVEERRRIPPILLEYLKTET